MARNIGPICKRCRSAGEKLFLKGEKCYTDKCVLPKRLEKQVDRGKKLSQYSIQLKEKQKLKAIYGVLEQQFHLIFLRAQKKKNPGEQLLVSLERRLDNTVYRLGFCNSRAQARQFVRHGHILVNGKKVNIPSYEVNPDDTISIKDKKGLEMAKKILIDKEPTTVDWLQLDKDNVIGKVLRLPSREDIKDIPVNTQLIVELYSK
ncbi:MAG: 30S ribosomal protein S4 [candidate division WOR-3 bacterium]|nr:30S ribosomal protein S4 [candidate division WOR-3 bacterium]